MEKLCRIDDEKGGSRPVSPRLLVVDDEQGFRDLLRLELTGRGYQVATANTGENALEQLRRGPVDLMLTDLTMPRMTGLELLSLAREIQPSMEVVILTGHATLDTALESMKRGAYDYLTKPFQMDDLFRLLERALESRELKNQVNRLQEIDRLKSEFLANMSHELRTPMNAILGYTSLMLEGAYGEMPERQKQSLGRVEINAKNLLQLINNVLDFSKIVAGRMPVYYETFSLAGLAKEVVEAMESLVKEKQLTLSSSVPENILVKSDKTKVKQILINLVGNGIKFTSNGGVTINAEKTADGWVRIGVADTGPGIAPEQLSQLFQEFRQLDASPTREHNGTGLGLAISKKLAGLLGGSISVESVVGQGTRFTVQLPIEKEAQADPTAPPATVMPEENGGKTVLAIDDDPEVLALLKDSLQGSGYAFAGAQGGEEGVAMARQLKPFAILVDIMMPHKDGWSVIQSLKEDPQLHTVPVVILSIIENKSLGYSLGVADYIVKPFNKQDLLNRLNRLTPASPQKILVVDDDEFVTELLQETMKSQGYQVMTCKDARRALEQIRETRPDILFLDLMMPHVSGLDVLDAIEKDAALTKMRVFVITAKNLTPRETDVLQKRVEFVIQKGSRSVPEILSSLKERLAAIQPGRRT